MGSSRQPHFETQQLNEESLECWETASIDLNEEHDEFDDSIDSVERRKAIRMANLKWRLGHLNVENKKKESAKLRFAQDLNMGIGQNLGTKKRTSSIGVEDGFERTLTHYNIGDSEIIRESILAIQALAHRHKINKTKFIMLKVIEFMIEVI